MAGALVLAAASAAHAAPLPEMIGAPGGSGGFNARVTGAGPSSTYFNPALLPAARESFVLDFFVVGSSLDITPDARPAGSEVDGSVDDAWQPDGMGGITPLEDRPLPTSSLAPRQGGGSGDGTTSYVGIGLVKQLFGPKLVLGLDLLLPAGKIQEQSAFYSDEREQYFGNSLHFEMLGDRLTLSTIGFGVGSQLTSQLSLGVGFSMAIATSVTSPVYVPDAADYSVVLLDNSLSVSSKLAPHFGVTYAPLANLSLSATLHTPFEVKVSGKNVIRVANQEPVDQVFTFVNGYEPLGVAAGAAWSLREDGRGLGVVGSASWRQWSEYTDRHGERPLDAWKDTFGAALGARWVTAEYTVHLDGQYTPSPVPEQDGRTSYVDNDRLGAATGFTLDATLGGRRYRGSLTLNAQRLLERSVTKHADAAHPVHDEFPDDSVDTSLQPLPKAQGFQSNNPGFPGYTSSGWLFGAGLSIETWF